MATYQGIKGRTVQSLASDPPAAVGEGQVWYNTGTSTLKTSVGAAAWASGGNLLTASFNAYASNAGTQTACIVFAGGPPAVGPTQNYDGSSWTEVADLNTARYNLMGAGTSTAALAFGGKTPSTTAVTEEWGGSSWVSNPSPSGDMGAGRYVSAAFGTQASAVSAGGDPYTTNTEEYGGTTWTAGTATPGQKYQISGTGTLTAGLMAGGVGVPGHSQQTESWEYDGTSWAAGGTMGTAAAYNSMFGSQTAAKLCGDSPAATLVQDYDGTSWSTGTAMTTARFRESSAGTTTAGIVIGGDSGGSGITTVEEFTVAAAIQTITSS